MDIRTDSQLLRLSDFNFNSRSTAADKDAPVKEPPAPTVPTEPTPTKVPDTPAPQRETQPGTAPLPCPGPCKF